MMEPFTAEFRETYREGFKLFKKGDWMSAKKKFDISRAILKNESADLEDPLSKLHLEFMQEHDYIAPKKWCGHKHHDE